MYHCKQLVTGCAKKEKTSDTDFAGGGKLKLVPARPLRMNWAGLTQLAGSDLPPQLRTYGGPAII